MNDAISSPLLQGLPSEDVERLLSAARRRRFSKGEVVFHEGDLGDSLHLIEKGRFASRITTAEGETTTLSVLGPGQVFGELALVRADFHRMATIVALEPAETLAVERGEFDRLREAHPEVANVLLRIVADTVERLAQRVSEAFYVPAEIRVLRQLLRLADIYADEGPEAIVPITQEDLAGMAGASRGTVNRVLRQEEGRGTISLSRARVRLIDRERLEKRALS
ncbi:MAG: Crp/Fnr family transcriptional regulator [Actinomycetota bacterium]